MKVSFHYFQFFLLYLKLFNNKINQLVSKSNKTLNSKISGKRTIVSRCIQTNK